MNESPLRITMTGDGDTRVVEVTGEVDLTSSPQLRAKMLELIERYQGLLVVDLAGVDYMDSSGVGTLVELKRRIERQGGRVVLARLQPRVRSVFEITQLDKFFTIVDDLDAARRA